MQYTVQNITARLKTKTQNPAFKIFQQGFTLIELLLVLFIIGLSVALSAPTINTGINRLKAKGAVKYLATTMRYARNQAISEKTPYYVQISQIDNKVIITYDDKKIEKDLTIPEDIIKIVRLSVNKKAEAVENKAIAFYPRGNSSGGILEFWNQKGEPAYRLTVESSTGKTKIDVL